MVLRARLSCTRLESRDAPTGLADGTAVPPPPTCSTEDVSVTVTNPTPPEPPSPPSQPPVPNPADIP
jgi:hypothetical protein